MLRGRACGPVVAFFAVLAVVFLCVGTGLAVWRSRRGEQGSASRSFLDAGIVVSVLFLIVGTMTPSAPEPTTSLNLVPFNFLANAMRLGGVDLRNALFDVVANVAVFVPLGLLVGLRFARPSILEWLVEIACLMIAIEVAQAYALGRSGDVTDVITNTVGAVLGMAVGRALRPQPVPAEAAVEEAAK
ncbi:MAG TPA: VanZ family protein [Candidatus Limnocylindrales bacterium]|nr:VanZ family protein [Candidatus Limnocylindrales bacterium]